MQIALYYAPITCALAPYISLTEAGAEFETRPVNFFKSQHLTPDYLKVTTLHKVPVLEVDGVKLTENVAIQLWIARTFPHAKLLPAAFMDEIKAVSLMGWFGSGIHPHLARINAPSRFCDTPGSADSVRALATSFLMEAFGYADHRLDGRTWFFDHFTATDAYFFWCVRRAMQFELPLSQFTSVMAHFERMHERASVRKLIDFEAETIAWMKAA